MKAIFDNVKMRSPFERTIQRVQTFVMIGGLLFFAYIAIRLILNF